MDEDRDMSRLLLRGLESFPELLQRFSHSARRREGAERAGPSESPDRLI